MNRAGPHRSVGGGGWRVFNIFAARPRRVRGVPGPLEYCVIQTSRERKVTAIQAVAALQRMPRRAPWTI